MTMKTRIFSMLLVVVMLVVSLAGCAYSYEKDDMDNYVEFNLEAFKAAIADLKIEDATFGHSESERQKKVVDAIITSLAGLVDATDTSNRVTDKVIGDNDLLYYCYYVTGVDKDDKAFTGYAASMKQSAAVKLQLGLSTTKDLAAKIEAKILEGDNWDFKDKAYDTSATSSTAVKAGDLAYVTYTVTDAEGVEVTYTNARVLAAAEAPAEGAEATSFEQHLIGMKPTVKVEADKKFGTDTYSDVTVNWIVNKGEEIAIDDYKPESKTEIEVVGSKTKVDLKEAKSLVYHVYPVYFIDVVEYNSDKYNATLILKDLLGSSLNAGVIEEKDEDGNVTVAGVDPTLDIFTDNGYKTSDGTLMNAIAKELVDLIKAHGEAETEYEEAEKDYDTAEAAYDKNKTPENKSAMDTAETAKNNAKTAMDEADKKVDDQIVKLLSCTKADADSAEAAIVKQYSEYRYESLEKTYENSIVESIAKAIHEAAVANIKYNSLPKKAVKEAYELLLNNYEYDFYEGTVSSSTSGSSSSTSGVTNYEYFHGEFYDYLRQVDELEALGVKADSSKDDVKAAITKQAEASVKDTMVIYVLKDACESISNKDLAVSDEDVKAFKDSINYILLQYYVGTNNIKESYYMPALQFDKVMDHLTEIDEDAVADANNADDKRVVFKNIGYDFK